MARRPQLSHRIATAADVPAMIELMRLSISENMLEFLSPEQIEAARETMGVDWTLIEDGTYFVIEATKGDETVMVGCGGWGKRRTLYGGDHTVGRDDSLSDPAIEAARIRAMYTHPEWVRCGIGSLLLELGEAAARAAGFRTIELGSTIPGEPFYLARGFREVSRETHVGANGADNVVIKMRKALGLPISTSRTTLRRLRASDLVDFQRYRNDPEVGRYQGWMPQPDAEALQFLSLQEDAELFQISTWFQLGIAMRESDQLIGDVGLCLSADSRVVEIGFSLQRQSQGKGLAAEAIEAAVEYVFASTGADKVIGITDDRNVGAIRLLEALGMQRVRTVKTQFRGEPCTEHRYEKCRTTAKHEN